jgi:hypothetical protein
MDYLYFENLTDAQAALKQIWINYVLQSAYNTDKVVGNGSGTDYFLSEIQQMTNDQIYALKCYGNKDGSIQYTDAMTEKYADPIETVDVPGKYVFVAPVASLLTGVSNYTVKAYESNWFPEPSPGEYIV